MKIRRIAMDTRPQNTAFLSRAGNGYSPEQFQALRKIEIGNGTVSSLAMLIIVDDANIHEIILDISAYRYSSMEIGALRRSRWPEFSPLRSGSRDC